VSTVSGNGVKIMKSFRKSLFCVVTLITSGILFAGCNNTPNTNSSDGPTILLSLSPVDRDFTWPPGTPTSLINSGNNNLQLLATTANNYQTYKWLPTEAKPPNYDWRVGIAPADASGVRYFDAVIGFWSSCGGAIPGNNAIQPWTGASLKVGSPTATTVLSPTPLHIVEVSPAIIGSYTCQGPYLGLGQPTQNFPGGEVGMYFIAAKAINGNGKTTTAGFTIYIGNSGAMNTGSFGTNL
jgi:hypothetical protein